MSYVDHIQKLSWSLRKSGSDKWLNIKPDKAWKLYEHNKGMWSEGKEEQFLKSLKQLQAAVKAYRRQNPDVTIEEIHNEFRWRMMYE
jgi:hypothetical protein